MTPETHDRWFESSSAWASDDVSRSGRELLFGDSSKSRYRSVLAKKDNALIDEALASSGSFGAFAFGINEFNLLVQHTGTLSLQNTAARPYDFRRAPPRRERDRLWLRTGAGPGNVPTPAAS
ncbi:unnamed protein product [Tilletia controversa]|nr:unnamed protein product [Tilletia controversa]